MKHTCESISIYSNINKSGYRYNVNHPHIRKLYERFKAFVGAPGNGPPSDTQRIEFEYYIDSVIARQKEKQAKK